MVSYTEKVYNVNNRIIKITLGLEREVKDFIQVYTSQTSNVGENLRGVLGRPGASKTKKL